MTANQIKPATENLILWIAESSMIPLKKRQNFVQHILKVGQIDDQSWDFIEEAVGVAAMVQYFENQEKAQKQAFVEMLKRALDVTNPESLPAKLLQKTEFDINQIADEAIAKNQEHKADMNQKAETTEASSDQNEIKQIKKTLQ